MGGTLAAFAPSPASLVAALVARALPMSAAGGPAAAWGAEAVETRPGLRRPVLPQRRQPRAAQAAATQAQIVEPSTPNEETEVWREAYDLEAERSELIAAQLEAELARVGDLSTQLREEFEGCLVDLDPAPLKPESEAANEWAQAYAAIRRCNEQSELQLTELRSKIQERGAAADDAKKPEVTLDFGPIRHMGITFKGITFKRFGSASGSKIFFVELLMPLGLRLEETAVELRTGGVARAVEVGEVVEGGSAFKDSRVRKGDYLRAITVPQRRLSRDNQQGQEEEVGNFVESIGVGAGNLEKALLVIPLESSFPFERVMEDIQKNRQIDNLVGMVFERPFD